LWSDFYRILLFAKKRIETRNLPVVSVVSVVKIKDAAERKANVLEKKIPIRSREQRKAPFFEIDKNLINTF